MQEPALLKFFDLQEQPFGVTPDPRYLYLSPGHQDALASLQCGIDSNCGFQTLIAPPGMGKTTILFHLLAKLEQSSRIAFLFQNRCTAREFMRLLLAELGVEKDTQDFVRMQAEFNQCLSQAAGAGRHLILIIDEAQNLEPSVLETIRLLSNFETPRFKLLQIILAGQPGLADTLMKPSLSQLRQRITTVAGLRPLTADETSALIDHRLKIAGYSGEPLFSPDAREVIVQNSKGIPREINKYCFHALYTAHKQDKHTIDAAIVKTAAQSLDIRQFASQPETKSAQDLLGRMEFNGSPSRALGDSSGLVSDFSGWRNTPHHTASPDHLTPEQAALYMRNLVRFLHSRHQ